MPVEIYSVRTPRLEAWIAWDGNVTNNYAYGGARLVPWRTPNEQAVATLHSLMEYESQWKNKLINQAIAAGAVDDLADLLPPGFTESRVGGARCVMRPVSDRATEVMSTPAHPEFEPTVNELFNAIGDVLNEREGKVKLTPDFGKYAGMADLLHGHTEHVLGVSCDVGGCGGKSSYSASGITAAYRVLEEAGALNTSDTTLIGSAGAMGVDVLNDLVTEGDRRITACDLKYDDGSEEIPAGVRHLPSEYGRFPDSALADSDVLIATTWGGELQNSDYRLTRAPKVILLAHNLSLPTGVTGRELNDAISQPGVIVVPGQLLTLGGALTSRLEWFSRASGERNFNKILAHDVVRRVVGHLTKEIVLPATSSPTSSPYAALLDIVEPTSQV